ILIGSWVPIPDYDTGVAGPGLDEAPLASFVVRDTNKRMQSLMKFAHGEARAADRDDQPPPKLWISIRSMESEDTPTLDPAFDRQMFVVETDRERLAIPVFDAAYPNWRALLANGKPVATDLVAYPADTLGRLGGLRDLTGPLLFSMAGGRGLTRIRSGLLFGALMPAAT
ncbi:MAG: hypothetical protein AAF547_06535, partial [Actinomycetota bacterium]